MMGLGPCGVPETEPNDSREQSVPVALPAMFNSCLGTRDDHDFYEVTAPSDPGGYLQLSLTGVTSTEFDVSAYSVADNGKIGSELYTDSAGQDLHAFLAVAGGQKYRLEVKDFAGVNMPPEKYAMKITYTKVADTFEPNNTKDTAKPITLGAQISAFMFEGFKTSKILPEDVVDWYTVPVTAGLVTVKIEGVPASMAADITTVDSTGHMVQKVGEDGTNLMAMHEVAAGALLIKVQPFFLGIDDFFKRQTTPGMLPEHFTQAYKLTVTQP